MTDLSISDLTIFWNGFQEEFDDWYDDEYWYTKSLYCSPNVIERFCHFSNRFSFDECQTYCVNENYCSLYWTKQAKHCCNICYKTCTSMEESVRGKCWTPITTKSTTTTTTTRVPSTTKKTTTRTSMTTTTTTTKNPLTTSSFTTTNGTLYTKQPFGKSPYISLPIVAGLLLCFIVIYLLRRRIKSSLNMSTRNRSNDSSLVYQAEIRPTAPSTDDDTSFNDNETNIQINPPLDTNPKPNAPASDAPPSYDDCITISPPSYDWQSNAERDVNTNTGGSLQNEFSN